MPEILNVPKPTLSKAGAKSAVGYTTQVAYAAALVGAGLGLYALIKPKLGQVPVVGALFAPAGSAAAFDPFGGL